MEYKLKVDPNIVMQVDSIKTPVWVYDTAMDEIVYRNIACRAISAKAEGGNAFISSLERRVIKEINSSLINENYGVIDLLHEKGSFKKNFQIIVSRISDTKLAIHFSERDYFLNLGTLNTVVFFSDLNGEIRGRSDKFDSSRFGDISNIKALIDAGHHDHFTAALQDSYRLRKSVALNNLTGHKDFFFGPIDIECIGGLDKGSEVVVVISEISYKDQFLLEKSRAELAEEINKILKLEISEHKKTQQRLTDSEMLSGIIINSSVNIILTFNQDQIITEFNRKAQEITGYSRDEVVGKEVDLVLKNAGNVDSVIGIVNEQGYYEGDLWCIKKDGTKFGVFAAVSLLTNNEGKNLGYVCNLRDISEINLWREKLAHIEERYFDLFENATDLIQGVNTEGKFMYTNKSWYKLLGYTIEERDKLTIFDLILPVQLNAFQAHFRNVLEGKDVKSSIWNLRKRDGDYLIVESNDNLKIKSGRGVSVRSIMRDITATEKAKRLAKKQSAKMAAIIESGNIMFWTVNRDIKLTSFNSEYEKTILKLYGKRPVLDRGADYPKDKFAPDDYHNFWNKKYDEVFSTGKSLFFQTKTRDLENRVYYRDIFLRPIRIDGQTGAVQEVAGTGIDVTEKMLNEQKVSEQAYKIQTIFDSANHMIWTLDTSGKITSFNRIFKLKIKERYGVEVNVGDTTFELAKKVNLTLDFDWEDMLNRFKKVKRLQFEVESYDKNNIHHIEDVSIIPIFNDEGEIIELAGLAQTVTFKKAAEKKLKDQASKINSIFNSTAMLIWTVDQDKRIVAYNKIFGDEYYKLLGKEVAIGNNFFDSIKPIVKKENFEALEGFFAAAFRGESQQFEGKIKNEDGRTKWIEIFLNPIYSEHNIIKEITCLSHDITDKKVIQKQMEGSIREKEILLQEVHHRVKNNLQVISSILNLQSSYVKDDTTLNILRESQNRIKSMSFIHESLYQTKDFSHIDFGDYVLSLSRNLIHSYSLTTSGIRLKTDFDKLFLSLDQAITCGLIINELISNALKYAFIGLSKGEIKIEIKERNERVYLTIADNGIGLPKDFDAENSDTLGLQLVYTLIDQLDAEMKINTTKGTKYLITFDKQ